MSDTNGGWELGTRGWQGRKPDGLAANPAPDVMDLAIDEVAREMTAMDAPAGMRAAVVERIEGAARSGRLMMPRWALAAGTAVVVLAVAAAVWFARPAVRPESVNAKHVVSSRPATGPDRSQAQPERSLASTALAAGVPAGSTAPGRAGAAVAGQADANQTAAPEMGPAPLPGPDPIVLADLGPHALAITSISVTPLEDIQPIAIKDIPVGPTETQRRQDR